MNCFLSSLLSGFRPEKTMANTLPEITCQGFPGGPAVKNPPANAGDIGSIIGPEGFLIPRGNKPMCRNN